MRIIHSFAAISPHARNKWLLSVVWLLLVGFQLFKLFHTPLWIDDGVFSDTAKNLASGHGYALTFFERLVPFDRGISTGPVVILPAALFIKVFGNSYWPPGLANILLIQGLLLAVYRSLAGVLAREDAAKHMLVFLVCVLLLTNHDTEFPPEKMHVWHSLMGEIPGSLLIVLSALRLGAGRRRAFNVFVAGLLAGLAALCKLQTLIGAGMLGCCLAAEYGHALHRSTARIHRAVVRLAAFAVGIVLPLALFEGAKALQLGGIGPYLEMSKNVGSAAGDIVRLSPVSATLKKIYILGEYLGVAHIAPGQSAAFAVEMLLSFAAFIAVTIVCCRYLYRERVVTPNMPPLRWAGNALLLACLVHFIWWLFICALFRPRYAIPGMVYGAAALSFGLSALAARNAEGRRHAGWLLVLLCCLRYDAASYFLTGLTPHPGFKEQQEVTALLNGIRRQSPTTRIFSCGYAIEMEYLLSGTENLIQCERIHDPQFARDDKVLLSYYLSGMRTLIYWEKNSFIPKWRKNLPEALALCPVEDLHSSRYYGVSSCKR